MGIRVWPHDGGPGMPHIRGHTSSESLAVQKICTGREDLHTRLPFRLGYPAVKADCGR